MSEALDERDALIFAALRRLAYTKCVVEFDGDGFVRVRMPDGCATTLATPSASCCVDIAAFVLSNRECCASERHRT